MFTKMITSLHDMYVSLGDHYLLSLCRCRDYVRSIVQRSSSAGSDGASSFAVEVCQRNLGYEPRGLYGHVVRTATWLVTRVDGHVS